MAKGKTDLPGTDLLFGGHGKKETSMVPESPVIEARTESVRDEISYAVPIVDSTEPVKFTFYFDPQLLEELEIAKFRLRMEKRLKVSKSDIVNVALRYVMKDINFLERMLKGEIK
jgi:hypothetical protein